MVRPFARHAGGDDGAGLAQGNPSRPADDGTPKVAIIQGRFCLAYQGGVCFTCSERCPVPDALTTEKGIPTVHADICTGCGICHDLCPAPRNAILMLAPPETPALARS
ncbi:MAG: 4Fe-4S binding protein [Verrucomicrobiae bacterium]|nr:4Fe-4S binding protein [Verrucomicrobiae bacterium]NNJ42744.1 4Fe-4S binding protein [Akkermansiaceae bacterium]